MIDMHRDDPPKGRVLTRREVLAWLGAGGALLALRPDRAYPQTARTCVVRPQQTEGPFFLDTGLERSDIRSDPATGVPSPGLLLQVTFHVSRLGAGGCEPLPDAHVELWQCDAAGVYSGVHGADSKARDQRFLRGYQKTDASGAARFTTIYPGWYPGRTPHVHFLIRTAHSPARRVEFTSQLYFDDALTDKVYTLPPYSRRGERTVRNVRDGLFRQGGSQLVLAVREQGPGLAATFDLALLGP